jgi:predicted hydrocarbon binding protein
LTEEPELTITTPRDIHAFHFSTNKTIFLGSVKLRDVPGALSNATSSIAKLGVNLVGSNSSRVSAVGVAEWGFFAEGDDGHITPSEIEAELRKTDDVIDCKVRGAEGRVLVDTLHYPLRLNAMAQAIIIRKNVFSNMLKFMVETYGSAGQALAYQLGKATGESDGMDLIKEIGEERLLENLPELINIYVAQGWGIPELVHLEFEPLSATVRLDDCFECNDRSSIVPVSNFIRGHLAGLAKAFFDKSIDCVETKCVARGDAYCEFVAKESFH